MLGGRRQATAPRSRSSPTSSSTRSPSQDRAPERPGPAAGEAAQRRDPQPPHAPARCRRSCSARRSTTVLHRYELRQLTSAEVVERLVEIAKQPARRPPPPRAARPQPRRRRRSTTRSPAAPRTSSRRPAARDDRRTSSSRASAPTSRWTGPTASRDRGQRSARKIKRLLRKHNYRPPLPAGGGGGGDSLNYYTALVLDQAKALYRYWPDTEEGRLFQ